MTSTVEIPGRPGQLDMGALDGRVSLLRTYYDLGVRWMLVAYNRNNRAGGGCQDDDTGLTAFGRQVIDAASRNAWKYHLSFGPLRAAARDATRDERRWTHGRARGAA